MESDFPTPEQMQNIVAIVFRLEPDDSVTCTLMQRASATDNTESIMWGTTKKLSLRPPDLNRHDTSILNSGVSVILNVVSAFIGKKFRIIEKNDRLLLFHREDY